MLHLPRHHDFPNVLAFQNIDHLPELCDGDQMHWDANLFDLARSLAFDRNNDDVVPELLSSVESEKWKPAVTSNQAIFRLRRIAHLMNPRSESLMNSSNSANSGVEGICSSIFARAWEVFSPDR